MFQTAEIFFALCLVQITTAQTFVSNERIPVIVISDLYSPAQDVGDNIDLINAYILPKIDLKAVLLDCHNEFRKKVALNVGKGLYPDKDGPRDPGYSAVEQLNYIFDRNIPYGIGPFTPMKSKEDKMEYISAYENKGLDLLKETLENAEEPVIIVSFGSLRILAVANNRYPKLLKSKVKELHISAGTSYNHPNFLEWNVALDTLAFVSVVESGLPINLYPCAAGKVKKVDESKFNAFVKDNNNTYYILSSLDFVNQLPHNIKHYIQYAVNRETKPGYLAMLDSAFHSDNSVFNRTHHSWETAIWMQVSRLKLVMRANMRANGEYKILTMDEVCNNDIVLEERLRPAFVDIRESGLFSYEFSEKGKINIYEREDAYKYEEWINKAIPDFYISLTKEKLGK
tara:strand:+ start:12502 stop:13698 length:1197 start_codon:yes stop_codon:yes gene_type:complete